MAYAKKEAIEEGLKEGLQQGKVEAARNLKALGVDFEIIVKATGLSMEQVQEL